MEPILVRVSKQRWRNIVYFDFSIPLHQRTGAPLNVDQTRPYLPNPDDSELLQEIIAKLSLPGSHVVRIHSCTPQSLTIYYNWVTTWADVHNQLMLATRQQWLSFRVTSLPSDRWWVRYLDRRRWKKM